MMILSVIENEPQEYNYFQKGVEAVCKALSSVYRCALVLIKIILIYNTIFQVL